MTDFPSDDPGLLATDTPGDNAPAMTVSELSGALKRTVEDRFGHVRVRGEISGWKKAASGHCYLCLKDENAVLDGVIWKAVAGALRFRPEDGVEVIATGRLTTYPGRSRYQIVIDRLELAGQGALMALLDKRRQALAAEGLFDAARKKPLPFLPKVIGVVTSPTGAVIRDILHRLEDRCPTHVVVWPVAVQGEGAAEQVAAALRGFDAASSSGPAPRPDLVIVARGGGSIEDLWAFNEEAVVRAVADCTIPVISAVGHETDTTLCDFAADMRAPTPTAAAELAVPVRSELAAFVGDLAARAERCASRARERAAEQLAACLRHFPAREDLLAPQQQRLDDLAERLPRALSARLSHARADLGGAAGALRPSLLQAAVRRSQDRLAGLRLDAGHIRRRIDEGDRTLKGLWRVAELAHPNRPLEKGYVRVEDRGGHVLTRAEQARAAGALSLVFADGRVDAVANGAQPLERPRKPAYPKNRPEQPKLF
ncbi:exodeoxyribonuclease VII large subunit [Allosphingosinicella flava]|uniref:Exodeoxyribonuclease 7 large subunit n=1 Tax=Allosphingosinicella flava TaxID=2771430 RepID=A0A7T2GIY3_9SPHN|nr:exodeoxyribonuclease VII large subunit [Sphingosinicella flava]QPQ54709.1 exodeoxyribonuclease VII large subunit [Sphingosinicella flava]